MRVKRGTTARSRRKKVLKLAKGFRGRSGTTIRQASARVDKALCYSYRDRRNKKRDIRSLWIVRINAAARINGLTYGTFISGLSKAGVGLDRKILANLGVNEPEVFAELSKVAASANEASSQQRNVEQQSAA